MTNKIKNNFLDRYEIISLLDYAEILLRETKTLYFRSRDVDFSQTELKRFLNLGLIKVVERNTHKIEVPCYYHEKSLVEIETNRKIESLEDCRRNFTYKIKDTKTITAYYNVYALTFDSLEEIKNFIKEELLEALKIIK